MDLSTLPNEDLYAMCLRGDQAAWGYLYNYVLKIVRSKKWNLDEQTQKDLAGDIFKKLLEKGIEEVRDPKAFRGFVKMVTVRCILDHFRKRTRERELIVGSLDATRGDDEDARPRHEPVCDRIGPEDAMVKEVFWSDVRKARDRLPEMCQAVLSHFVSSVLVGEDASFADLAGMFRVSESTMRRRVSDCLGKLEKDPGLMEWGEGRSKAKKNAAQKGRRTS